MQHSKCCVVSQPPWVQIPALPQLPPGPIGAGRFCYAYVACVGGLLPRQISGRCAACPPARSPSAPRALLGVSARSPARPRRPRGGLQSVGVPVCCLAWPRRLRAPQPGPPVTAGALHASGAFVADVAGASACCSARTRRLEACQILSFACNSPETLSNHELTTLELQRFQTLLKLLPIELHARFGWRWCRRLPRVPRPGPVGQVARWCETIVAFARWCRCGVETVVAFAGEK